MNFTNSHPKKSPSSKARHKPLECGDTSPLSNGATCRPGSKRGHARALYRTAFRAWRASLPTALERDTLLMPDAIAESVVQEAERFLKRISSPPLRRCFCTGLLCAFGLLGQAHPEPAWRWTATFSRHRSLNP